MYEYWKWDKTLDSEFVVNFQCYSIFYSIFCVHINNYTYTFYNKMTSEPGLWLYNIYYTYIIIIKSEFCM